MITKIFKTVCFPIYVAVLVIPIFGAAETPQAIATEILAPLLNPAKVDTLKGDRPINARMYRVLGWLETARQAGDQFWTL
jgi:hypothetical protein